MRITSLARITIKKEIGCLGRPIFQAYWTGTRNRIQSLGKSGGYPIGGKTKKADLKFALLNNEII